MPLRRTSEISFRPILPFFRFFQLAKFDVMKMVIFRVLPPLFVFTETPLAHVFLSIAFIKELALIPSSEFSL